MEEIRNKIMKVCEEHKIRLTPSEYQKLVEDYVNHFITNISIPDLIQLSDNVKRRS